LIFFFLGITFFSSFQTLNDIMDDEILITKRYSWLKLSVTFYFKKKSCFCLCLCCLYWARLKVQKFQFSFGSSGSWKSHFFFFFFYIFLSCNVFVILIYGYPCFFILTIDIILSNLLNFTSVFFLSLFHFWCKACRIREKV
jgi:hypothetical protein